MIEKIAAQYTATSGACDLAQVVSNIVEVPEYRPDDSFRFLQDEFYMHKRFRECAGMLAVAGSVRGAVADAQDWEMTAYSPVPLDVSDRLPGLTAIPFVETRNSKNGSGSFSPQKESQLHSASDLARRISNSVGFYFTVLPVDRVLSAATSQFTGLYRRSKDIGLVRRYDPRVIASIGLHITPIAIENQRRFEMVMNDVFGRAQELIGDGMQL